MYIDISQDSWKKVPLLSESHHPNSHEAGSIAHEGRRDKLFIDFYRLRDNIKYSHKESMDLIQKCEFA